MAMSTLCTDLDTTTEATTVKSARKEAIKWISQTETVRSFAQNKGNKTISRIMRWAVCILAAIILAWISLSALLSHRDCTRTLRRWEEMQRRWKDYNAGSGCVCSIDESTWPWTFWLGNWEIAF